MPSIHCTPSKIYSHTHTHSQLLSDRTNTHSLLLSKHWPTRRKVWLSKNRRTKASKPSCQWFTTLQYRLDTCVCLGRAVATDFLVGGAKQRASWPLFFLPTQQRYGLVPHLTAAPFPTIRTEKRRRENGPRRQRKMRYYLSLYRFSLYRLSVSLLCSSASYPTLLYTVEIYFLPEYLVVSLYKYVSYQFGLRQSRPVSMCQ